MASPVDATPSVDDGLEPFDPVDNPYAAPSQGARDPLAHDEISRSPKLIRSLRCVEGCCEALGFVIAAPGSIVLVAGGVAIFVGLSTLNEVSFVMGALSVGVGIALVGFGVVIQFRQMWAIWIIFGFAALAAVAQVFLSLWTLSLLGLLGAFVYVPPIWLCAQILNAAQELEGARIPLSARIRNGRIERI